MEVGALSEGIDQHRVVCQVREHPELDLRVVGGDQHVPRISDDGAPDFASGFRAHGDVLQIRIAAAQAPGCRNRLVERRMQPAGLRVDELRQRVDVRAFQLLELAPLQDEARQLVRVRQLLEHIRGR